MTWLRRQWRNAIGTQRPGEGFWRAARRQSAAKALLLGSMVAVFAALVGLVLAADLIGKWI